MNRVVKPPYLTVCSLIIAACLCASVPARGGVIDSDLAARITRSAPAEEFPVIVKLKDFLDRPALFASVAGSNRPVRQERVIRSLKDAADRSQQGLKKDLEEKGKSGRVRQVRSFWIINGFALTAPAEVIREIAARDDVAEVVLDRVITIEPSAAGPVGTASWNLNLIGAPILWSQGFRGQGVVVANLDTGVDITHPALKSKWRGGTNSWFDPYRNTATPYDRDGHGTGTMGIMVGGNMTDNTVGVAPAALWIAAKIFDDTGNSTLGTVHDAFQWVLNPGGNPALPDAPDVVNNSWDLGNPGSYFGEFSTDIQNLRGAGIVVVFSAGNGGPPSLGQSNTSVSPGNNPGALPVGATDSRDQIATYSSRGPSAYDGSTYPLLVAPGENIPTTGLNGAYTTFNRGTSFAAPHVAGAIALLLSGRPPQMTGSPDAVTNALTAGALDLGPAGPDNTFGYGRLDAANAVALLGLPSPPTPTGDVNGDGVVDILDALLVLQAAIGLTPVTPQIMQQGDVAPIRANAPNPDGVIDGRDALVILEKVVNVLNF